MTKDSSFVGPPVVKESDTLHVRQLPGGSLETLSDGSSLVRCGTLKNVPWCSPELKKSGFACCISEQGCNTFGEQLGEVLADTGSKQKLEYSICRHNQHTKVSAAPVCVSNGRTLDLYCEGLKVEEDVMRSGKHAMEACQKAASDDRKWGSCSDILDASPKCVFNGVGFDLHCGDRGVLANAYMPHPSKHTKKDNTKRALEECNKLASSVDPKTRKTKWGNCRSLLSKSSDGSEVVPTCEYNQKTYGYDLTCDEQVVVPGVSSIFKAGGFENAHELCTREASKRDPATKRLKYGSCEHLLRCKIDETKNPRGIGKCVSADDCKGKRNCIDGECVGDSKCPGDSPLPAIKSGVYTMQNLKTHKYMMGKEDTGNCGKHTREYKKGDCRWKITNVHHDMYTIQHVSDKKWLSHSDGKLDTKATCKAGASKGPIGDECLFKLEDCDGGICIAAGKDHLVNVHGKLSLAPCDGKDDCRFRLK